MSWSLTASGHTADPDNEALLIEDLKQVLTNEDVGAGSATLITSFHGTVDLLAADPVDPDASPDDASAQDDAEGAPSL
jgi:hypothetical protein